MTKRWQAYAEHIVDTIARIRRIESRGELSQDEAGPASLGRQSGHRHAQATATVKELKWTNKALSDLVRLHEFLAPVNPHAAARTVQALTALRRVCGSIRASTRSWRSSSRAKSADYWLGATNSVTRSKTPRSTFSESGTPARIAERRLAK